MEKRVVFRSVWLPYLLLAPQLLVTVVFFFLPAFQAIYQSLLLQDAFGLRTEFVWFDNFKALFNDDHYLASFKVTAIFSLLVASLGLSISLMLAVAADRIVRGAFVFKTLLIWPYAVAPAIAGVLWAFLFAPSIGIFAFVLKQWGIPWNYLLDGDHAMILVVIASVWKQISYNFLFFLAGLQGLPSDVYEAADIDGAGWWVTFRKVTIPMLAPTTLYVTTTTSILALQLFSEPYLLFSSSGTPGTGPENSALTPVSYLYNAGFRELGFGYASAIAWVLFLFIFGFTLVQFRRQRESAGGF